MTTRRRVAFLTDEHAAESAHAGGLGQYLAEMGAALAAQGHAVEVFCRHEGAAAVRELGGVRLHLVPDTTSGLPQWLARAARVNWRFAFPRLAQALGTARALADAFRRRHREAPFDLVQSTNCSVSGVFLCGPGRPDIPHVVRLSSLRDLWWQVDGVVRRDNRHDCAAVAALERVLARGATQVYAPSVFLARYAQRVHGLPVAVVRPSLQPSLRPQSPRDLDLPPRYLVHFGSLMRRKGTDRVAAALELAWQSAPDLAMVWAGRTLEDDAARPPLAPSPRGVLRNLGPLPRPLLHGVVAGAVASVLPSRVDNLPNTAIESLTLRVGVIGARGASLDELVEDGRSGALVRSGDVAELARAMVAAWRGEAPWVGAGFEPPALLAAHPPTRAAQDLLAFAGVG